MVDGKFSVPAYEKALSCICRLHCPSYERGNAPIEYVVAGTWRKCPLKCITCFNHYEDNSKEPILSDAEMDDYLLSLGAIYAEAKAHNVAMGAPGPLLQIGGSGDLFHSENYSRMLSADLYKYGIDRIHLLTNMQFWSDRRINRISPGNRASIRKITFSVDSINRELYERIRQGSSWLRLMNCYSRCVSAFPDAEYEICYTVSRLNVHEYRKAPAGLKALFPAVTRIVMNMARDWAGTPESATLVLPANECRNIAEWCASYKGNGYEIVYHGL